jgi:glycosyltransferase involved in cell wall biosynthesis
MSQPILSILICSHTARRPLMDRMVHHLEHQRIFVIDGVEILTATNDDYMERGKTRNQLLDAARGEYCCFVDDDDVVSDDYIEKILAALENKPDICGITGQVIQLRYPVTTRLFHLSVAHPEVFSLPIKGPEREELGISRFASHLCPIRTEIARQVRFPKDVKHEDNGYSGRLQEAGLLRETIIEGVIYYYFYRANLLA